MARLTAATLFSSSGQSIAICAIANDSILSRCLTAHTHDALKKRGQTRVALPSESGLTRTLDCLAILLGAEQRCIVCPYRAIHAAQCPAVIAPYGPEQSMSRRHVFG